LNNINIYYVMIMWQRWPVETRDDVMPCLCKYCAYYFSRFEHSISQNIMVGVI